MEGLRVVIAGPTGSGKSAAGNAIFGRSVFTSAAGSCTVTQACESAEEEVEDVGKLLIVDTPSPLSPGQRRRCLQLCAPGPHAFLLTLRVGRYDEEDRNQVESLEKVFGEAMYNFTTVLFTHRDNMEMTGERLQDHIENANPHLKSLLEKCGQRYHVFDNRKKDDRKQVKELVKIVDEMVQANGGKHYERPPSPYVKIISVCTLFSCAALLRCLWTYWNNVDDVRPVLFSGTVFGIGIIWLVKKTLKY
ncbi:GTPase IMAP family member 7-like [Conger conger]|uniref:GTPase IMAP family member 7-like n=1 Tax=Conger conger TaxID=82655 RepID=UPI002A59B7C3|nr:GTPase IMAP family member 7-like [Conger conger]